MKICFIVNECNFFYSHRFELAKKLASFAEIFLITDIENTNQKVINKVSNSGINIHPVQRRTSRKGISGLILYFFNILNATRKIQPSAIFFVTLEISLIGVMVSWFTRKTRSFYLITGFGPFLFKKNLKNRLLYLVHKIVFFSIKNKQNSQFIFQNLEDKNIFIQKRFSSEKNSFLIHGSGINEKDIKYSQRDSSKPLCFLFSSRLVKAKGIKEYLEAGKIIKDIYPEVSINIAGKYDKTDPDTISKKLFIEIQNSDSVNYLGDIDHDDIQGYYLNSDIFVLPSYGEGLPKSALEAAASGMPLILSNASGCKECLIENENGLLIEMKNVESLKLAMESMILNPKKIPAMSLASRQLIKEKFSIDEIAYSYKNLIC
tara:strand:- start:1465 stop:2589 length:1125 start_codon:yes stop_codon:yes gene_type:complete